MLVLKLIAETAAAMQTLVLSAFLLGALLEASVRTKICMRTSEKKLGIFVVTLCYDGKRASALKMH